MVSFRNQDSSVSIVTRLRGGRQRFFSCPKSRSDLESHVASYLVGKGKGNIFPVQAVEALGVARG
jgi:hypothetical protein